MDNIEQLQVVVKEVQAARQQLANLRAQVLELESTLRICEKPTRRSRIASTDGWSYG